MIGLGGWWGNGGAGAQQGGGQASNPLAGYAGRMRSAGMGAPLQSPLDRIHRELKKSFDPAGIFNPGRMYPGL